MTPGGQYRGPLACVAGHGQAWAMAHRLRAATTVSHGQVLAAGHRPCGGSTVGHRHVQPVTGWHVQRSTGHGRTHATGHCPWASSTVGHRRIPEASGSHVQRGTSHGRAVQWAAGTYSRPQQAVQWGKSMGRQYFRPQAGTYSWPQAGACSGAQVTGGQYSGPWAGTQGHLRSRTSGHRSRAGSTVGHGHMQQATFAHVKRGTGHGWIVQHASGRDVRGAQDMDRHIQQDTGVHVQPGVGRRQVQ
ncbi:unnamed protein product [Eretmochelys imbricata]